MTDDQKFCYLSQFDLFDAIPANDLKQSAQAMVGKRFEKGDIIYRPDQESQMMYVLEAGEVMLYHNHDGKMETFDTIGPGTLFGNFAIESKFPTHFAEATRETYACVYPVEDFMEVLKSKPELMLKFIQSMAERLQDYEKRFKNNLRTAKDTIYDELTRLKEKRRRSFWGKYFGYQGPPIQLTHEQIAHITGLNRVTVTRSLKELKEDGQIIVDSMNGVIEIVEKRG